VWTSDGIFRMIEWLSPRTIASSWESWESDDLDVETYGPVRARWWNPAWIPITLIGGATFHHCVDMDPAPGGTVGQIIEIGKEPERIVIAPSLAEFVAMLAADVRAGAWAFEDGGFDLVDEDDRSLGGFSSPYYPR
jgi:cell wall assembly regulator SMI1